MHDTVPPARMAQVMSDSLVRIATSDDAASISQLGRETFVDTFAHLFAGLEGELEAYLEKTFSIEKLTRSLDCGANRYWLAMRKDEPVGYAKLKMQSTHHLLESSLESSQLQKIYLNRHAIGNGLGTALMKEVLSYAAHQGRSNLWLSVHHQNHAAQKFYAKSGWQDLGADEYRIGSQLMRYRIMGFDLR